MNTDYEGDIKQSGDTVWVRTYGDVSIGPYRRGTTLDYSALRPSKESLVVNDSQYFAFQVDDLDQAQNDLSALDGYTNRAAVGVNNVVERKLLSYYTEGPALDPGHYDPGRHGRLRDHDRQLQRLYDAGHRAEVAQQVQRSHGRTLGRERSGYEAASLKTRSI